MPDLYSKVLVHKNGTTPRRLQVNRNTRVNWLLGTGVLIAALVTFPITGIAGDKSETMEDALSAAWPGMAKDATVVDWEGNVLREGSNGYTCFPTPANLSANSPMCMDSEWMEWADAWSNKKEYVADTLGISYMLAGDGGASNIDPYAEGPTADNEWIREGAHLMILVPPELLERFPTDPHNGGPYVMWKGTPYAHLMVPIGSRE
jgi:hypothetical protein